MYFSLDDFPNSRVYPFLQTSPVDGFYNCIAWAYGVNNLWFWPEKRSFWPKGITRTVEINSFIELFASIGYKECSTGDFYKGVEKIAIYVDSDGIPTHAARQLNNGLWTSKLGGQIDISHTIEGMAGGFYGDVRVFMERSVPL